MDEHKVFKTAAIPVVFMITGLEHFIQNPMLSIIIGAGIWLIAFLTDRFIKKR